MRHGGNCHVSVTRKEYRPGRIIPGLSSILLLFDSPEITHYSHNFVRTYYSQQTIVRRCNVILLLEVADITHTLVVARILRYIYSCRRVLPLDFDLHIYSCTACHATALYVHVLLAFLAGSVLRNAPYAGIIPSAFYSYYSGIIRLGLQEYDPTHYHPSLRGLGWRRLTAASKHR